tara:strand:- start:674 stop:859 length:186 start_codon:yes stop_codon:yes gene_type:complete
MHEYSLMLIFVLIKKSISKSSKMEQLEEGKTYAWCACAKSENNPCCNGAQAGSEFTPNVFN